MKLNDETSSLTTRPLETTKTDEINSSKYSNTPNFMTQSVTTSIESVTQQPHSTTIIKTSTTSALKNETFATTTTSSTTSTTTTTARRVRNTSIISRKSKYDKYEEVFLGVFIPFIWLIAIAASLAYYYREKLKLNKRVIIAINKSKIKKYNPNEEVMI